MTYIELHDIATPYIEKISSTPGNSFSLAMKLGIPFKTEKQCEEDYGGKMTPLRNTPAFLAINGKEKVIYFNSNTRYWNFYMFHEIAHYILEHDNDSPENEADANMLACILMAPVENLPSYLKTARDLSCLCSMPIDKAEEYWEEIYPNVRRDYVSEVVSDYLADVHSAVGRLLSKVECLIEQRH